MHPGSDPPGNLIHEVTKSSEARAVKMLVLFFRDGGFCGGKIWISRHSSLSAKDYTSLLRFFYVSVLNLESFQCFIKASIAAIIYRKIKETYAANKKGISHSANTEWTL